MTETFAPRTVIDQIAPPVRMFRGALQRGMATLFVRRSGRDPEKEITVRYGWEVNTCIEEIDRFNSVARWQIRFASTPFALYLLWLGAHMPVGRLDPIYWPAVAWLVGQIVLLGAYDPIAGVVAALTDTEASA